MPLMFRLLKGESSLIYQRDSFEPRTARKRVGWDKPPALAVGSMSTIIISSQYAQVAIAKAAKEMGLKNELILLF